MGFVNSYTGQYTVSVNSRGFVTDKQIPAGSFLIVTVGCTGAAASCTAADSRGNTYVPVRSVVNAGVTANIHILACRVTTTIQVGDTITATLGAAATSQRWNFCAGWFDDIDGTPGSSVNAGQEQSSQFASSTALAALNDRSLVIGACCFTGAGDPAVATSGATLITSMITTAGSAERGLAVSYEYDTASSRSATFTLAASATVVTAGAVWDAVATPAFDTGNSATDNVIDSLGNAGFSTGSLRDRQMAQHIAAGRVSGSYSDRVRAAGGTQFPK